MEIITMLVIGLLVGIVAKFLMPGDDPGGFIITTLLGIAVALMGWRSKGWGPANENQASPPAGRGGVDLAFLNPTPWRLPGHQDIAVLL